MPIDISHTQLKVNLESLYNSCKHAILKQVISLINSLRNFAIKTEMVKHAPAIDVSLMFSVDKGGNQPALKINDLPKFISFLKDEVDTSVSPRLAILAIIASLCRRDEVLNFDPIEREEQGVWHIPASRMKNKQDHLIFEPPLLTRILDNLQSFLSKRVTKNQLASIIKKYKDSTADSYHFTTHGFRAMASTYLNRAKPEWEKFISLCQSHKFSHSNAVDAHYNRYGYEAEKRMVWEFWCEYLEKNTCINDLLDSIEATS